ncbi:MAG: HupE/UreJ family protein [Steroidobacteraceae bacterium]
MKSARWQSNLCWLVLASSAPAALAHGVSGSDASFVAESASAQVAPFIYLGAKHMVTGYDHLLFILGVIFFLYRMRDVALYVTLFSIGHSITLLAGVFGQVRASPWLVDAVIGLSVAYKAFDNLGGFRTVFGVQPDARLAVLGFGLVHGFGLATKLLALKPAGEGLVANMVSFNVGVELGQLCALAVIVLVMARWRRSPGFKRHAFAANVVLMGAGFLLTQYQLAGYFLSRSAV